MTSNLIDIGANLAHESFSNDLAAVLERARDAGVRRLIVTGTSLAMSRAACELAGAHPGVLWATAGVHPHDAAQFDAATERCLVELLAQSQVVAAGECGLDYFRDFAPRAAQRDAFARQLELAAASNRPLFLHQRDAHADFLGLLKEQGPRLPAGVAHCFTGTAAEMQDYLDLGLHIGITGWICDERRSQDLRAAVARLPLDRVLLETDAPYLLPRNIQPAPRSRRNEPAFLPAVLHTLASFMGQDAEIVAACATRNTERLFGIGGSINGPS